MVHAPSQRRRLTALSFCPLQHFPGSGVHFTRGCLTLYVALSGFDYPLSGLLLLNPLNHYFRFKRSWGSPFRVLLPSKSCCLSRGPLLSCRFVGSVTFHRRRTDSDFRALLPLKSRTRTSTLTWIWEPLLSWGFHLWGVLSSGPANSFEPAPLLHFPVSASYWNAGALEFFCQGIGRTLLKVCQPLWCFLPFQFSNLFGVTWATGLSLSPKRFRNITAGLTFSL